MYQLENPHYFYLFLVPIIVLIGFVFHLFWKKQQQQKFATHQLMLRLAPRVSVFKSVLKVGTLLLAMIGLIIALINPKIGTKLETVKRQGIDIVFAIDISKSMLAEDVAPSRLERGKQLVSSIITTLANDRIGIIGYAGSAYPVLPMTTDYSVARMYLKNMTTNMVSSQGTALNQAVTMATNYFDDSTTNKLILLISDGEDHGSGIEDATAVAKEKGIKIITIGVGTEAGERIPIKADNNVFVGYKKDSKGETVITKRNNKTLEKIAETTNGKYITEHNTKKIVEQVKNAINTIEKTEFETQQVAEYQTQFQWFVGFSLLLIIIEIFFLEQKTKWLEKLNLFNEKK